MIMTLYSILKHEQRCVMKKIVVFLMLGALVVPINYAAQDLADILSPKEVLVDPVPDELSENAVNSTEKSKKTKAKLLNINAITAGQSLLLSIDGETRVVEYETSYSVENYHVWIGKVDDLPDVTVTFTLFSDYVVGEVNNGDTSQLMVPSGKNHLVFETETERAKQEREVAQMDKSNGVAVRRHKQIQRLRGSSRSYIDEFGRAETVLDSGFGTVTEDNVLELSDKFLETFRLEGTEQFNFIRNVQAGKNTVKWYRQTMNGIKTYGGVRFIVDGQNRILSTTGVIIPNRNLPELDTTDVNTLDEPKSLVTEAMMLKLQSTHQVPVDFAEADLTYSVAEGEPRLVWRAYISAKGLPYIVNVDAKTREIQVHSLTKSASLVCDQVAGEAATTECLKPNDLPSIPAHYSSTVANGTTGVCVPDSIKWCTE